MKLLIVLLTSVFILHSAMIRSGIQYLSEYGPDTSIPASITDHSASWSGYLFQESAEPFKALRTNNDDNPRLLFNSAFPAKPANNLNIRYPNQFFTYQVKKVFPVISYIFLATLRL